ncbi:bombyxin G-1-like [Malaya genurostris]|uniref:bombyxin G-1-like n=1 Tax=Malaya genurostris TaxID=325434 RepID=UPI0026F3AA41|nr:bombyxin G-1-like [Malaya genurostris]
MRSVLGNPTGTLLMVPVLATLFSLLVHQINASPVPVPSNGGNNNGDSDVLLHHITRSRYCGRKLTETLAMLCQGRYPMMSHHRSEYLSDQPQLPVEVEVATLPNNGAHGFPYLRSKGHRRVRRAGIYDECCKKSCSYNELRSYCE